MRYSVLALFGVGVAGVVVGCDSDDDFDVSGGNGTNASAGMSPNGASGTSSAGTGSAGKGSGSHAKGGSGGTGGTSTGAKGGTSTGAKGGSSSGAKGGSGATGGTAGSGGNAGEGSVNSGGIGGSEGGAISEAGGGGIAGNDGIAGSGVAGGGVAGGGIAGTSGTAETGGTAGTSGTLGSGGTAETGGTAGSTGTSGTGGADGTAGTGGTAGTDGTAGTGGTIIIVGGAGGESGASGGASAAGASGANGTDAAGNGGESSLGGAGGGLSCSTGIECGNVCVDPATRALDQIQLDMPGFIGLSETQWPGESFTVGQSGILTGIEIAAGPCNGADVSGDIKLELFSSTGTSLGAVTVPQSTLPNVCGGNQLVAETIGAPYFDLTPLCISAAAGDQFTFILSVTGNPPVTCDSATHRCANNGRRCSSNAQCAGFFYVGETNCGGTGCQGSPSSYPGGSEVMQNVTTRALQPEPAFELAFKTFMQ